MHGRRWVLFLVTIVVLAAVGAGPEQSLPVSQEVFRGGTELLVLDVSVFDSRQEPVRGLTARDFTVRVDGLDRSIVATRFVDYPAPVAPAPGTASWVREVTPDVATNRHPSGRLVAIVIDDYSLAEARLGPGQLEEARDTAVAVIDALTPDDRAAVLFTANRHTAQPFTTDRDLLRAAAARSAIVPDPPDIVEGMAAGDQGYCDCGVCSMRTLEDVARTLRSVPDVRKTLVYISAGSVVVAPRALVAPGSAEASPGALRKEHCAWERFRAMDAAMRQVQIANVRIEAFDPTGLQLGGHATPDATPKLEARPGGGEVNPQYAALEDPGALRVESLRAMADATGGRAVVNNNDMRLEVPAVLAASGAYYLLGVEPPPAEGEGRFHAVEVQVDRPNIQVRTRRGYYDRSAVDRAAEAALASSGGWSALAAPIAEAAFPLEVVATPVATSEGDALAVVVGIWPPDDTRPLPYTDTIDVTTALFNPETGRTVGSRDHRLNLTWQRADARFGLFEFVSMLPAPPGRHELRVGVTSSDGRRASVHSSVEVPDFAGDLALSGLMLSAAPAPPNGRADDTIDLMPTTRRVFRRTDDVAAFVRIYQRAEHAARATVTTTIQAASGEVVATDVLDVDGTRVGSRSDTRYEVALPMATLDVGEYLLTVAVDANTRRDTRRLRFIVE